MGKQKLGFGMLRLPLIDGDNARPDLEKVNVLVDAFLAAGNTYFDTSFVYHSGHSEETTRKTVVERHPRESFTVTTKLPVWNVREPDDVVKIFEQQLKNVGVDYLNYYLVHNVNSVVYENTIVPCHVFETLNELKKQGRIKNLGYSHHDSPELLDRILTEHPEIDFVQIVLNYYDWTSSWVRSRECYETIRKHHRKVIIMEPVKGGMLAHPPKALEEEMKRRRPNLSPAQWAMRFCAEMEDVIAVLSGMNTLTQIEENTALLGDPEPLTEEERRMLIDSAPSYRELGPWHISDFSVYSDIADNGMPVAEILENYNIRLIQNNLGVLEIAEQCYYSALKTRLGGPENGSWIDKPLIDKGGNDITEMVREAEGYFLSL